MQNTRFLHDDGAKLARDRAVGPSRDRSQCYSPNVQLLSPRLALVLCFFMAACSEERERPSAPRLEKPPEAEPTPGPSDAGTTAPSVSLAPAQPGEHPLGPDASTAPVLYSEEPIFVDDVAVGTLRAGPSGTLADARWTAANGSSTAYLERSREIRFSGIIDLSRSGTIPGGGTRQSRFQAGTMKKPALVLRSRGEGYATGSTKEELVLIDARTGARLFQELVHERDADGYGGFTLKTLSVQATKDELAIVGQMQEELPSRRARCMRPAPYPVEYVWTGAGFAKRSEKLGLQRSGSC